MSLRPSPPPIFPEPFQTAAPRSANGTHAAGDSAYLQVGLPPGHAHPSQRHRPNVYPAQLYPETSSHSSARRRFTTPPTNEHAYSSHPSAPVPLSGVSERYASHDSWGPPSRVSTMPMPMPARSNVAPTPYNISPPNITHPTPHLEMTRGPQPSQGLSYNDISSEFSGGGHSHSPEDTSTLSKGPMYLPFSPNKRPGKRSDKGSGRGSSSGSLEQLPCTFCGTLSPREVIDRLGGFCSERHWWEANKRPCRLCGTFCPREVIESWGGFCNERHRREAHQQGR